MNLPNQYEWILAEPGPKMVREFLKLYGVHEVPGTIDNADIMQWAKELGLEKEYIHDAEPWCGLFMALIAKRAGKVVPTNPLWAKNWANFGHPVRDGAKLGDTLIFNRPGGGGHVCLYIGEDDDCYHCAGGNQSDMVSIIRKPKDRIYAIRRPDYRVTPDNVRKVILTPEGLIDNRED